MNIPNNLRIGSKPTKELIDEGVPANSALVGACFYFETGHAVTQYDILADGYTFEYVKVEKVDPVAIKRNPHAHPVCAWMR